MINVSLSTAYTNKNTTNRYMIDDEDGNKKDGSFSHSFIATEISVEKFIHHILDGNAWAVGVYKGNHRKKENFISSDVLALDLDDKGVSVAECLETEGIGNVAALIHPSPSSTDAKPKTRIMFVLDRPIDNRKKWELAQAACLYRFRDLQPDPACKDAARFYYGCNLGEAHENPNAVLTLEEVAVWVADYKKTLVEDAHQLSEAPGKTEESSKAVLYAEAAYKNVCDDLFAASEGSRNTMLNSASYNLFGMAKGMWPGITNSRIENDLAGIAKALGLKEHEIRSTLNSARSAAPGKPMILNAPHQPLTDYNIEEANVTGEQYQQTTMDTVQRTLNQLLSAVKKDTVGTDDLQSMAAQFNVAVDSIMSLSGANEVVSGHIALKQASVKIAAAMDNPQWITGLRSNLTKLDYAIGGFPDGGCYTFSGETKTGKTTLAATIATEFSRQEPGLIISCENSEPIFMMKMVAYLARIPYGHIKRGGKLIFDSITGAFMRFEPFSEQQKSAIKSAQGKLHRILDSGTIIAPGGNPTPAMIKSMIRQHSHIKWLILDSLNNIQLPYYATEYENVSQAALMAENVAVVNDLTVINTVQIGRSNKNRANKSPELHDNRGSGLVEEKATALIGLYNHAAQIKSGAIKANGSDETNYPEGTVQFNILALRDGDSGVPFNLKYDGGCGFYND